MKQKHEKLRFYRFYLWLPVLLTFCFVDTICAQAQFSVNGIVKDDSGQTLPGVTVLIKGQKNGGTVTDINGGFHIEVPNEATLSFSFIGYETKEVPVDNQKHLNVTLATKTQEINDMVVVGYQSIRKKRFDRSRFCSKNRIFAKQGIK